MATWSEVLKLQGALIDAAKKELRAGGMADPLAVYAVIPEDRIPAEVSKKVSANAAATGRQATTLAVFRPPVDDAARLRALVEHAPDAGVSEAARTVIDLVSRAGEVEDAYHYGTNGLCTAMRVTRKDLDDMVFEGMVRKSGAEATITVMEAWAAPARKAGSGSLETDPTAEEAIFCIAETREQTRGVIVPFQRKIRGEGPALSFGEPKELDGNLEGRFVSYLKPARGQMLN